MACRPSHPLALFSLVTAGDGKAYERAVNVVDDPLNAHLVSSFSGGRGERLVGLDVGFHVPQSSVRTVATIGRNDATITVSGADIGRTQCSFEIQDSGVVMLYDRSFYQSTQTFGEDAVPFESE